MLHLIALLSFTAACLGVLAMGQARGRRLRDLLPADEELATLPDSARPKGWPDRWERLTMRAGLGWSRRVYLALAGAGLLVGLLLGLLGLAGSGLLAVLAGLAGPWLYARRLATHRTALFARQLPPALFLAASVLRAGGTMLQAVEAIAREMDDPVGAEFRQIRAKMRLQVPAHQAMGEALERVGLREFAAVVVAARIATEVGGDLAHIFEEIGRAVADAQSSQRALRALTTEGRLSADLIAALPFLVMSLLHLLSPDYFAPYWASWSGRALLALCLGAIYLGWRTVRRMVDIRIE
ncbi:MAG: type II secretion system F family protein [Bacillota bacterium]